MKNTFQFLLSCMLAIVPAYAGCPFASLSYDQGMMHAELFHKYVRTEGKSLNPKAFQPSLCKLPNPNNLSREGLDQLAIDRGLLAPLNSLPANHLRAVKADDVSLAIGRQSLLGIDLYRLRQTSKGLAANPIKKGEMDCVRPINTCKANYKYRTYDGRCNNLKNPSWGQSHTAFGRILQPDYSDGLSDPRVAHDGSALPSPRLVSATIVQEIAKEFPAVSLIVTSFGQLVAHDLTLAVSFRADNDKVFDCCAAAKQNLFLAECIPIDVPTDDDYYARLNQTCLPAMRTAVATHSWCDGDKPVRQQINQVTSYLDAGVVYGSDDIVSPSLRSFCDGKLLVGAGGTETREFPPHSSNLECDDDLEGGEICVKVGDIRGNEQPLITTQQVVFLRYHNYIARELKKVNPHWNDETLYQESRRILGAAFQHIVYSEFLPVLLGDELVEHYALNLVEDGYYGKYNKTLDASLFNEFGAAAYRYGHSTVPGLMKVVEQSNIYETQRLSDFYLTTYRTKLVDQYVRGFVNQRAELVDNALTKELSTMLFIKEGLFGHDLASLNINRGRDHGLPSYAQYRRACGLSPVRSFEDLAKHMDPVVVDLFQAVYKSVLDIDLWIAGISETPFPGAIVGPTFACIIGRQFKVLRDGDRFWYENGGQPSSFSEGQLDEIRQISMAGIFCQVTDVKKIQPLVMRHPDSKGNRVLSCTNEKFPTTDFSLWKERPSSGYGNSKQQPSRSTCG